MDQKELQQQIAFYYSKLPKEAQELFSKMEWLETLKGVSAKYGLTEAQIQALGTETTLVLLGIIGFEEYENIFHDELALPKETTVKILAEINQGVFASIRPQLAETFSKNIGQFSTELDKRFDALSEDIKTAIINSNYQSILYSIGQVRGFNVTQMGLLEEATVDVMLGTLKGSEFKNALIKKLNVKDTDAVSLVVEINDKILKKIRKDMIGGSVEEDRKALSKYGIEIDKKSTTAPEHKETSEEILKRLETPELPAQKPVSIISQKLGGSFQVPKKVTEHTLDNISKPAAQAPKTYPANSDPYRMKPE